MIMEDEERYYHPVTDEQKKGLEFISRAMSKKYKFIKSIELYDGYEQYENLLFVNVVMDYSEFAKTYKYYTKKLSYIGKIKSSSISPYMSRDEESWMGPTDDDLYYEIRSIRDDIDSSMNTYYSSLPPEYQATYKTPWGNTQIRYPSISEYIDID